MPIIGLSNRMRPPGYESEGCGDFNQFGMLKDFWALMLQSTIYSILGGIWSGRNTIGILG
jgi:hypothetical protein